MADFLEEVFTPETENVEVVPTPEPTPEVEPEVEEAKPVEVPQGYVPLAALLDERDKRKAADKEREELRSQIEQPTQKVIDPYDDPDGYHRQQQQFVQQALINERFETSDLIARQAYGDEAVEAAAKWAEDKAKADPSFAAGYMRERHPINWIVQQHQRDSLYSQIPTDVKTLDELIEREIAKRGLPTATQVAPPALAPVQEPPRSIASDRAPVNATNVDPVAEFNAIFKR